VDLQGRGVAALSSSFHVQWAQNLIIGRTLYDIPSDVICTQINKVMLSGSDGFANQTSPDVLLSEGKSVPFLTYGSINGTSIAGLYYENSRSKIVFLGFGFEAISKLNSQTFMQAVSSWFDASLGVSQNPHHVPLSYDFRQVYPNPFNPTCQLEFHIRQKEFVEVELYNILGQKVKSLISSELKAGQHRLTIDGAGLSSGSYICRIHSDTYNASQKNVLLK
jgi:Secretion system C-terminal sorting domain